MSFNHRPTIQNMHYGRVPTYSSGRGSVRLMTYQGFEPAFDDAPAPQPAPMPQAPPAFQPQHVPPPHFVAQLAPPSSMAAPPKLPPASPALTWKQKYMRARMEQKRASGEVEHAKPSSARSVASGERETGLGHTRGCSTCTMPKIK